MSENSICGMLFGTVRITDLDFADDSDICEADPFGDVLDATIEEIPVNDENMEVMNTFTNLPQCDSSVYCLLRRSNATHLRWTKVCGTANSCAKRRKFGVSRTLILPVFLYSYES